MTYKLYILFLTVTTWLLICFFPIYEMVLAKQLDIPRLGVIILATLLVIGMAYDKLVLEGKNGKE